MDTRSGARIVHFGPFSLDSDRRRLHRGLDPVRLPDRQLEILLALVARPGHVVSKDALIERAWHGSAVADSSLTQAVKELRKVLGNQCDGTSFIENAPRLGYRFAADVSLEPPSTIKYDSGIDPYLAFVEGRAALETLDRTAIARASEAFSAALQLKPDFAAAHIGIANALFLDF